MQNTIRQLGGAIGGAAVGAVLQNRLAASLHDQAQQRAGALPRPFRDRFVGGFDDAASHGLQVGSGQSGAKVPLPKGLPRSVVEQIQRVAHAVFTHGYVDAMHPTLVLPIAVIALAGSACLGIKRHSASTSSPAAAREMEEAPR